MSGRGGACLVTGIAESSQPGGMPECRSCGRGGGPRARGAARRRAGSPQCGPAGAWLHWGREKRWSSRRSDLYPTNPGVRARRGSDSESDGLSHGPGQGRARARYGVTARARLAPPGFIQAVAHHAADNLAASARTEPRRAQAQRTRAIRVPQCLVSTVFDARTDYYLIAGNSRIDSANRT